ncbi:uncharacterized protein LOC142533855 [Primulina tabacum]|uniref:uncharacterized protein LOC142533855 n=1 Tax=Primulina tabacum TaxID=48773 RepID=UPI003F59800C
MQIRHPEVMSPDVSLMDRHFYTSMSVLAEEKDNVFNTKLVGMRRHDPNFKDLNEEIELILINAARLLSIVGNNPHPEMPWNIKLHDEFSAKIIHEDSGAFVLAVARYSLSRKSEQLVLTLDDRIVSEFRYFLAYNMFLNDWSLL